jgi:hypothetical protein
MSMPAPMPNDDTRWRCGQCGNLTRFDVTRTVRSREYVHVDLAGQATVEEREVLAETVERVLCRWCQRADTVVIVPRPDAGLSTAPDAPGRGSGTGPAGSR